MESEEGSGGSCESESEVELALYLFCFRHLSVRAWRTRLHERIGVFGSGEDFCIVAACVLVLENHTFSDFPI